MTLPAHYNGEENEMVQLNLRQRLSIDDDMRRRKLENEDEGGESGDSGSGDSDSGDSDSGDSDSGDSDSGDDGYDDDNDESYITYYSQVDDAYDDNDCDLVCGRSQAGYNVDTSNCLCIDSSRYRTGSNGLSNVIGVLFLITLIIVVSKLVIDGGINVNKANKKKNAKAKAHAKLQKKGNAHKNKHSKSSKRRGQRPQEESDSSDSDYNLMEETRGRHSRRTNEPRGKSSSRHRSKSNRRSRSRTSGRKEMLV